MDKKGDVTFFCWVFFCPKSPKNIVGEPFCVSEMFWYQKFLHNRSTQFCRTFLSHIAKNHLGGNPSVFQKFRGFKICRIRGVSRLYRLFLSHSTESFRVVGFCLSEKLEYGKSFWIRRGCHVFPSIYFVPIPSKNFVGEPFRVSEMFW